MCVYTCACIALISVLPPPPQMAPSRGPSTPHGQRTPCGPSGRASSRHRTTQNNSHILRETSRTCSLWVTPALESPQTDVFMSFSQNNPGCFLNVIQDMLSILDQPPNFNNDDFEISIYSQFNEWPVPAFCHSAVLSILLPSVFLSFFPLLCWKIFLLCMAHIALHSWVLFILHQVVTDVRWGLFVCRVVVDQTF